MLLCKSTTKNLLQVRKILKYACKYQSNKATFWKTSTSFRNSISGKYSNISFSTYSSYLVSNCNKHSQHQLNYVPQVLLTNKPRLSLVHNKRVRGHHFIMMFYSHSIIIYYFWKLLIISSIFKYCSRTGPLTLLTIFRQSQNSLLPPSKYVGIYDYLYVCAWPIYSSCVVASLIMWKHDVLRITQNCQVHNILQCYQRTES